MFATAILRSCMMTGLETEIISVGSATNGKLLKNSRKIPSYGEKKAKRRGFQDFRFQTLQ